MTKFCAIEVTTSTPNEYVNALSISIPIPTLKHSFRLICDLNQLIHIGEGIGEGIAKNWISFSGGFFVGSFGKGVIVQGGQDSQTVLSKDHPTAPYSAQLSTRYLLKTEETEGTKSTYIQISTKGWRTGSPEVMLRLSQAASGEDVVVPGPEEYKFRLFIEMETDSKDLKYSHLNQSMWVGSGVRSGRQVIYDAYLIE